MKRKHVSDHVMSCEQDRGSHVARMRGSCEQDEGVM